MVQRKAAESIEQQKHQMVAALYSNPNWDDEKNDRPKQIEALEANFNKAIELVYAPEEVKKPVEIDWDNPFWAAAKRAYEKRGIKIDEAGLEEIRDHADEIEEYRKRRQARIEGIDQLRG